mmetsp:Transcript_13570/g.28650  ORF Transcript_13570/g.28650 Transcript_13570/m.28650 type:complete len:200 (+) Transcript_13570:156-755(+)
MRMIAGMRRIAVSAGALQPVEDIVLAFGQGHVVCAAAAAVQMGSGAAGTTGMADVTVVLTAAQVAVLMTHVAILIVAQIAILLTDVAVVVVCVGVVVVVDDLTVGIVTAAGETAVVIALIGIIAGTMIVNGAQVIVSVVVLAQVVADATAASFSRQRRRRRQLFFPRRHGQIATDHEGGGKVGIFSAAFLVVHGGATRG